MCVSSVVLCTPFKKNNSIGLSLCNFHPLRAEEKNERAPSPSPRGIAPLDADYDSRQIYVLLWLQVADGGLSPPKVTPHTGHHKVGLV